MPIGPPMIPPQLHPTMIRPMEAMIARTSVPSRQSSIDDWNVATGEGRNRGGNRVLNNCQIRIPARTETTPSKDRPRPPRKTCDRQDGATLTDCAGLAAGWDMLIALPLPVLADAALCSLRRRYSLATRDEGRGRRYR